MISKDSEESSPESQISCKIGKAISSLPSCLILIRRRGLSQATTTIFSLFFVQFPNRSSKVTKIIVTNELTVCQGLFWDFTTWSNSSNPHRNSTKRVLPISSLLYTWPGQSHPLGEWRSLNSKPGGLALGFLQIAPPCRWRPVWPVSLVGLGETKQAAASKCVSVEPLKIPSWVEVLSKVWPPNLLGEGL